MKQAKAKGKHMGRPKLKFPDTFPEVYEQWKQNNITAKKAIELLGISPSSFLSYREKNMRMMKGGDMSKGFCIIGRYVRNGKAPLDTRDWVEKAECLKGVLFGRKRQLQDDYLSNMIDYIE